MKTNPTAIQIAQYTSTVKKNGRRWTHQVFDEQGVVIATRNTANCDPYVAAQVLVSTRKSRIASYKRDADKTRCNRFARECRQHIADILIEIASGADENEYFGCELTWTRITLGWDGVGACAGYSKIVARRVPCVAI
jgi:hypothetical protein